MSTVAYIPKPLLDIVKNVASECHVIFNKHVLHVIFVSKNRDVLACASGATETQVPAITFSLDLESLSLVKISKKMIPISITENKLVIGDIEVGESLEGDSWLLNAWRNLLSKFFLPKTKIEIHESRACRNLLSKALKLHSKWFAIRIEREKVTLGFRMIFPDPDKTVLLKTSLIADPPIDDEIFIVYATDKLLDLLPYDVFRTKNSPPITIAVYGELKPIAFSYILYNYDFTAFIAPLLPDCVEIMKQSIATREELEDFIAKLDDPEDKKKLQQLLHYLDKLS